MSIPACRYIGSFSSLYWMPPATCPSISTTSSTAESSPRSSSSITSTGSGSAHQRDTDGSARIARSFGASPVRPGLRVTLRPTRTGCGPAWSSSGVATGTTLSAGADWSPTGALAGLGGGGLGGGAGHGADEAADLVDGVPGLGQEAPEDVEVVRRHRVDRDAGLDAALGRVPGQQLGLLQDGIAGGGLDEQRRQPGQGRLQRAEQRVVDRVAGQVGLGQAVRGLRREDQ